MPRDAGRGTTMGHGNPAKLSELSVGRVVVHSRGPRTTGGGIVKVPPQQLRLTTPNPLNLLGQPFKTDFGGDSSIILKNVLNR